MANRFSGLSGANKLRSLWQIVSQINMEEIQEEISRPFHLLIAGDTEQTAQVAAQHLSDLEATFVHPWLTITDEHGSGMRRGMDPVNCAIIVTAQAELSQDLHALQQSLSGAAIPSLVIVVGAEANSPEAVIPRRGEQARIGVEDWTVESIGLVATTLWDIAPADLRLALAHRLPPLRQTGFQRLIQETSQANATYSFTTGLAETIPVLDIPLNVSDLIVLTKNQLLMAYKIALVAGKTGTPRELMGEIISVLGGGFLFRQIAREMVGLIPVWGLIPKVAVAYAGTWTIGNAIVIWAIEGRRLTPELMKSFYADALERGRRVAQEIAATVRKGSQLTPPPDSDKRAQTDPSNVWQRIRQRIPRRSG